MYGIRGDYRFIEFLRGLKELIHDDFFNFWENENEGKIDLYLEIGKKIAEDEKIYLGRGTRFFYILSKELKLEFPHRRGFSERNLHYMKRFYMVYKEEIEERAVVASENYAQEFLAHNSWGVHVTLLDKCDENWQREYYLKKVLQCNWSQSTLIWDIEMRKTESFWKDREDNIWNL